MKRFRGFSLLEVVVAMAILAMALMAIFRLNAGAVAMHSYTKKLTVASMLARSKMTDLEQELYDKGFPLDDEERSGDFSSEGWSGFKWQAKIIAPKTQNVSTSELLSSVLNIPMGSGGGSGGPGDLLSSLFPSGKGAGSNAPSPSGGGLAGPGGLMGGAMAGLAQGQMGQFLNQIRDAVREVRLTVSWKNGKQTDSIDVVTDVVSSGPGSDRNGMATGTSPQAAGLNNPNDPLVNPRTGAQVANPLQGPSGAVDPADPSAGPLVPSSSFQNRKLR